MDRGEVGGNGGDDDGGGDDGVEDDPNNPSKKRRIKRPDGMPYSGAIHLGAPLSSDLGAGSLMSQGDEAAIPADPEADALRKSASMMITSIQI
jgi:hypothetical protein